LGITGGGGESEAVAGQSPVPSIPILEGNNSKKQCAQAHSEGKEEVKEERNKHRLMREV